MSSHAPNNELDALRIENDMLKAENSRLKHSSPKPAPKKSAGRSVVRKVLASVLVVLAVVLLAAANILFWFGNTVVKQDRFVAATQPVIKDPTVQDALALYTTNSIFANVDVQKRTEEVLPPRADFLAPQLTGQLKSFTESSLQKALANPSLQNKWNDILSMQHQRLINFAAKYQGNGTVSLNDLYNQLSASLSTTKLSFLADKKLPPKVGEITVINASWLPTLHNVVVHIDTWRFLAVVLLVLLLAAALWLSRNRRRTIYIFGFASAGAMLLTLIATNVAQGVVAGKVEPPYAEGVRQATQIILGSLVNQTVTILAAVLVLGFVAWVSGPSRSAVSVRSYVGLVFSGKLHRRIFAQDNKYTLWVQKNKRSLQWGVVAILVTIMLLVRLTLRGLIVYSAIMLVAVLVIEAVGGESQKVKELARGNHS